MINTENLTKDFGGGRGVFNLSLSVPEGSIYGFIGPNGAGKTTTIKCLCGLMKPKSGKAYINNLEVIPRNLTEIKKTIGYMPDKYGVYEQMSVWEYLDFFCAAFRIPAKKRRQHIEYALKLTNGEYMLDYRMGSLSHGMGKRISLARTLLHDPAVIIMDEPANGLDPYGRIEMRRMIQELQNNGKTILLSSHILPELSSVCDQVGIVEKGKLLAQGSIEEIMKGVKEQLILSIMVDSDVKKATEICSSFPNVQQATPGGNEVRVVFSGTRDKVADLNVKLVNEKVRVISIKEEEADLEEA
ncbi:MAG: ABC transporter ATP-binding protein, partial [Verrucomicrobiota bacterium]